MTKDVSLSCCTKDEGRPLGFGDQILESNYLMRPLLRVKVASDREKAELICHVCSEEMNENEPLMRCRYVQTLSKPGTERISGMSFDVIWKRAKRQSAWRWHEFRAGYGTEHENLSS